MWVRGRRFVRAWRTWLLGATAAVLIAVGAGGAQAAGGALDPTVGRGGEVTGLGTRTGSPGVAFPPTGAVVFTSGEDGYGIFVANADGTSVTRVTSDGWAKEPVWSPDGKKIAFVGGGDDSKDPRTGIFVVNPDGTGQRRVSAAEGRSPVWSPDGRRIAFTAGGSVYAVGVDGTGLQRLSNDVDGGAGVAWSPDGKRIAYSDGAELSHVVLADSTTGVVTLRSSASFERIRGLAWSPDGTAIAFTERRNENDPDGVRLVDAATGRVVTVVGACSELSRGSSDVDNACEEVTPAWSPDSRRIALVSGDWTGAGLFTIGRDGHDARRLTTAGYQQGNPSVAWSGDGRFLVYQRARYPGVFSTSDVWLIGADGTGGRPVTRAFPLGASFESPRWAATKIPRSPAAPISMLALPVSRSLTTKTLVTDLSADGSQAAFEVSDPNDPFAIWETRTGARARIPYTFVPNVGNLTLAGARVAWQYSSSSNETDEAGLMVRTLPSGAGRTVAFFDYKKDEDAPLISGLAGDGSLLVYNTWRGDYVGAPGPARDPKLWRVVGAAKPSASLLLTGPDAVDVVSVDRDRIAVLRRDGMLVVLDQRGKRLHAFRLGTKGVEAVRLAGSQMVVLRGRTIEVRDAARER